MVGISEYGPFGVLPGLMPAKNFDKRSGQGYSPRIPDRRAFHAVELLGCQGRAGQVIAFGRYALGATAIVATLAGCGGTQPPVGAPGAIPKTTAERMHVRPAYTVLYSFKGGPGDGYEPYAGLINVNGTLYGTTFRGGGAGCQQKGGCGTAFTITPSGTETVLHSFKGKPDGGSPWAALTNVNGTFYGTTETGGAYKEGTVFSITSSGKETVLHVFGGNGDAAFPYAGLINVNGTLYGTTDWWGRRRPWNGLLHIAVKRLR